MTRTFLVDLDTESDTDLLGIAADIQDALESDGFLVQNVRPWSEHNATLGNVSAQAPLVVPPANRT